MKSFTDNLFVKTQYATSANLDARIALHEQYSTATQGFHDWLFDRVHLPANARVLEIGCGSGAMWKYVAHRVPATWNLTLTDYSFGMATQARTNLEALISNLSFAQTDAQALPFPDQTFDGIFANHMLYHVPDIDRVLSEFHRVLKQGGTLYTATNGRAHMGELDALVSRITGKPQAKDTPEQRFGLENGGAILARHFQQVGRDIQENDLKITDVEPLVAYVNSGWMFKHATASNDLEQEFRRIVQNEIASKGAFHITKAVGLFISR